MLKDREYICQRCSTKETKHIDDVRGQRLESKLIIYDIIVITYSVAFCLLG